VQKNPWNWMAMGVNSKKLGFIKIFLVKLLTNENKSSSMQVVTYIGYPRRIL
jgi:hypothetical protein